MKPDILSAPPADSNPVDLADWLELRAFFSEHSESRLDEVDAILRRQSDEDGNDVAENDAIIEQRRNDIELEVTFRKNSMPLEYPFAMSSDGERLFFRCREKEQHGRYYLLCLILSHATRSAYLNRPPTGILLERARKTLFQVLSVLAIAGEACGPSIWLGWPRISAEQILDVVRRACNSAGTGQARATPAAIANPNAKDGGIDVLSWPNILDRPPPSFFLFGQAASGHNWQVKPSKPDADELLQHYFDLHPQCDLRYATVIPFRISDEELQRKSRQHGVVLDRTRAPTRALEGYRYALNGVQVDGHKASFWILRWLFNYRKWALEG